MLEILGCVFSGLFMFHVAIYIVFMISVIVGMFYHATAGDLARVDNDLELTFNCIDLELKMNHMTTFSRIMYFVKYIFTFPFIVWEVL